MTTIHNRKLNNLITNVFNHIPCVNLEKLLDTIQHKESYKLTTRKVNSRSTSSNLLKLFNCKQPIVNTPILSNTTEKIHKPLCSTFSTVKTTVPFDKIISKSPENVTSSNYITSSNHNTNNTTQADTHISSLSSFVNEDISIIENDIKDDYLSNIYFSSLSNSFYIQSNSDKTETLKQMKLDLITIFNKENYYKKYDYTLKHFKKIEADRIFAGNLPITIQMLKIYGDIMNVNVVYMENYNPLYITKYNPNNATCIIQKCNNKIYSLKHKTRFIRGDHFKSFLKIDNIYSTDALNKMKLTELQNIAYMKNLNIKQEGRVGKVNIKKDTLINNIVNCQ